MKNQVAYEGYAMKRGNSFPWGWKQRYLMIWNDGTAKNSDKANSDTQTNAFQVTDIEEIEISKLAHSNNGYGFMIKTNDREWYLSVNSNSDWQVLNESYEYFLAHHLNCVDLAEQSFVKRIKITVVPPSIKNDQFKVLNDFKSDS